MNLLYIFSSICLLYLFYHYIRKDKYIKYLNDIININLNNTNINSEIKYFSPFKEKDLVLPKIIEFSILMNASITYLPNIVIGVLSSPHNFKKRYSFRKNSKKYCNYNTKCIVLFFIGYSNYEISKLLEKEHKLFNDVVKFSLQNSYLNLTLLSIMAIKYCFRYYKSIKYYIKTDDDMLINYNLLFYMLNKIKPNKNVVYGHLDRRFKPNRNNKSRAFIPYFEYPYDYIPKYVYGGLIIITKISLKLIYNQTLYKQYYVWKEDVNLGILCNLAGNSVIQFPNNIDIKLGNNKCIKKSNVIATEINSYEDRFYCIK